MSHLDDILLSTVRIGTYDIDRLLTSATGFFYEHRGRLFLVTANHVVHDAASGHRPSRLVIDLHTDQKNLTSAAGLSIPLYIKGASIWRGARDSGGDVDVAVIEIDRMAMPENAMYRTFSEVNMPNEETVIKVGSTLLTVGYPLGFHDQLHLLPVVRQAGLASAYGVRFQGLGYFLVDARTHRGISGAPVVMRMCGDGDIENYKLLGVHASRLEAASRDPKLDEVLGLNAVWYADVLNMLT
ncbi:trypsin-like peptidase domain-containing protein [Parvularcula sp. LCG005]|uniref:trypsin-like peptidase domain-containing protein n=1 Tax=Parvularcula sp. LCG005 TaxID=3078805 RepID=UPI00294281D9|nr:trypsin-like peptidase domain-containing protein [Parvularcula sp. LCG005]WOI52190.1 trypsin-like peptidase domain-containing protein [Parvularcula sp. LCG005]